MRLFLLTSTAGPIYNNGLLRAIFDVAVAVVIGFVHALGFCVVPPPALMLLLLLCLLLLCPLLLLFFLIVPPTVPLTAVLGSAGANNYPLKGGKMNNWEGGIRVNGFISGGFLPAGQRGITYDGLITAWDYYATFSALAGVDPTDHRAGTWALLLLAMTKIAACWARLLLNDQSRLCRSCDPTT